MKTFAAVSVESTITHVTTHSNNTLNNVVTTIAAQVNPPYTTADVLTTSHSVNDDVFKSSNLDEEDLQVHNLHNCFNKNVCLSGVCMVSKNGFFQKGVAQGKSAATP